tara:strand:+ start:102 stop:1061 length:960 start_codon:yes stop_codon:yes gene_type:complete
LNPNRNIDKLISNITSNFKVRSDILNQGYNIKSNKVLLNICSPPQKYITKSKTLISLLEKKEIQLKNHSSNGRFRILWTGWEQLSQLVACCLANKISIYYNESRAIEQTNFTKKWVNTCGTWENEYKIIKKLLEDNNPNVKNLDCSDLTINEIYLNKFDKNNDKKVSKQELKDFFHSLDEQITDKELNNILINSKKPCGESIIDSVVVDILKRIWDKYSLIFSKYNKLKNTIIVIPETLDDKILNKTLVKIELENLNTTKICLVMFQETGNIIVNPHLDNHFVGSKSEVIFDFKPWNKGSKSSIKRFLKKYKGKKIIPY